MSTAHLKVEDASAPVPRGDSLSDLMANGTPPDAAPLDRADPRILLAPSNLSFSSDKAGATTKSPTSPHTKDSPKNSPSKKPPRPEEASDGAPLTSPPRTAEAPPTATVPSGPKSSGDSSSRGNSPTSPNPRQEATISDAVSPGEGSSSQAFLGRLSSKARLLDSAVRDWLVRNGLGQYNKVLAEAGYDDVEDLVNLVANDAELFSRLIPAPGHRAKIRRLLLENVGADGTPMRPGGEDAKLSPVNSLSQLRKSPSLSVIRSPSQGDLAASAERASSPPAALLPNSTPAGSSRALFLSEPAATVRRTSGFDVGTEPLNLKIIVVGAPSTGKTSFIKRLVDNTFSERQAPTIGVDYFTKKYKVGKSLVTLQLWDIWGQDSCSKISRSVFVGAKGAVIVYDCTNQSTLASAADWKTEIDNKLGLGLPGKSLPTILIGNKSDLPTSERVFKSKDDAQEYCNRLKFVDHRFTSAKTGEGVQDAMEFLLVAVMKNDPPTRMLPADQRNIIMLDSKLRPQKIVPQYPDKPKSKKGPCGGCS